MIADKNKDGKLDRDEFKAGWALCTVKPFVVAIRLTP